MVNPPSLVIHTFHRPTPSVYCNLFAKPLSLGKPTRNAEWLIALRYGNFIYVEDFTGEEQHFSASGDGKGSSQIARYWQAMHEVDDYLLYQGKDGIEILSVNPDCRH